LQSSRHVAQALLESFHHVHLYTYNENKHLLRSLFLDGDIEELLANMTKQKKTTTQSNTTNVNITIIQTDT